MEKKREMDYVEMKSLAESLGWKYRNTWANRDFYVLGIYKIIEHCGDWFIPKDDDLYFVDGVDGDILKEYTAIVSDIMTNLNAPDNCTLGEYLRNRARLNEFHKKYGEREYGEEDIMF